LNESLVFKPPLQKGTKHELYIQLTSSVSHKDLDTVKDLLRRHTCRDMLIKPLYSVTACWPPSVELYSLTSVI